MTATESVGINSRTILIAGGGIGGLTVALCLRRAGFRVELFETAAQFDPVGAGLQLSPNACAVFDQLGLLDRLKAVSTAPLAIEVMSAKSGKRIVAIPLGEEIADRYSLPYLVAHRADLHQVLVAACQADPDIHVSMAASVEHAVNHANGVTALVRDGARLAEHRGLALIAADGVWSRLRRDVFGGDAASYSGLIAWRALLPAGNAADREALESTRLWLSPEAHCVTYPLRNRQYLNVVLVAQGEDRDADWSAPLPGPEADLLAKLHPNLIRQFGRNTVWTRWPLYTANSANWHFGNMALLGDAAHAMTPFAAQGAAMAIEDAAVLARCLADSRERPEAGLAQYVRLRKPRVLRTARLALANKSIYHLPEPLAHARDLAMKLMGGKRLLQRQDWIYRWTPAAEYYLDAK